MAVVLVSRRDRDNGMSEVVLSEDGVRFRALVSTALADSGEAYNLYQVMSNNQRAEFQRLQDIRARVGGD